MKSTYEFNSAQEVSSEILEAIKTAYGNKPVKITIESIDKNIENQQNENYNKNSTSDLTETIIDIVLNTISKKSQYKK